MPFDRQPSGASTDGAHSDSGVYGSGETTSMLPREVDTWTSEDVSEWLRAVGLEPLAKAFAEHGIDGYLLLRLTEHDLDRDLPLARTPGSAAGTAVMTLRGRNND